MTATTTRKSALDAFLATKREIDDLLARLQAQSDDHFGTDPDAVNWGDVGSIRYTRDRLREALPGYA